MRCVHVLLVAVLCAASYRVSLAQLTASASAPSDRAMRAEFLRKMIAEKVAAIEPKVIAWRRELHQYPELSNREFRTSKLVAEHLKSLGLEVQTGIAHTGVVGLLRGAKPGRWLPCVRIWTLCQLLKRLACHLPLKCEPHTMVKK